MTDRRSTITLNWRPAGMPARRYDDFAEVSYEPHRPAANEAPTPERGDIGRRLENWGTWARELTRTGISPTAAFCDRLRREAMGDLAGPAGRRQIDDVDARRIEAAILQLPQAQVLLLKLCYVEQSPPEYVARKCRFRVGDFVQIFRSAQRAVEAAAYDTIHS